MKVILEYGSKLREDILDLFDEIEPLFDRAREEFDTEPFERLVDAASSVVRKAREDYQRPGTGAGKPPFCIFTKDGGKDRVAVRADEVIAVREGDLGNDGVRSTSISFKDRNYGDCYFASVTEEFETVISRLNKYYERTGKLPFCIFTQYYGRGSGKDRKDRVAVRADEVIAVGENYDGPVDDGSTSIWFKNSKFEDDFYTTVNEDIETVISRLYIQA